MTDRAARARLSSHPGVGVECPTGVRFQGIFTRTSPRAGIPIGDTAGRLPGGESFADERPGKHVSVMNPIDNRKALRGSPSENHPRHPLLRSAFAVAVGLLAALPATAATINGSTPYLNGNNVPWNDFGTDFGTSNYSSSWFNSAFAAMHAKGVNSARIWLHCDGRATPTFNSNGDVTGISSTLVANLQDMLNKAQANDIKIYLSLWSFDLFNNNHASLVSNLSLIHI